MLVVVENDFIYKHRYMDLFNTYLTSNDNINNNKDNNESIESM